MTNVLIVIIIVYCVISNAVTVAKIYYLHDFCFCSPPPPIQKWHECLVEFSPPCLHLTEYEDFRLEVRKKIKEKLIINGLALWLTLQVIFLAIVALACSALCIHIGTIFSSTFYIWGLFFFCR